MSRNITNVTVNAKTTLTQPDLPETLPYEHSFSPSQLRIFIAAGPQLDTFTARDRSRPPLLTANRPRAGQQRRAKALPGLEQLQPADH